MNDELARKNHAEKDRHFQEGCEEDCRDRERSGNGMEELDDAANDHA